MSKNGGSPAKTNGKPENDLTKPLVDEEQPKEPAPRPAPRVVGASVTHFRFNLQLAFRTAGLCVLCSLPIFIPEWNSAIEADPTLKPYLPYVGGGTVLMVIFTVYANYGSSVQLMYQGMIGTFFACFWVYFMSAIMPNGAAGDHYYAPLAHACHICFVVVVMWLNLSKNVRMFILSYHVYFAMEFMNPSTPKGTYNTSWYFDFDSEATTTMLTAAVGLVAALFVLLLPCPIFAKRAAQNAATSTVNQVCNLMDDLVEYFNRESASVLIAQMEVSAKDLRSVVDSMQDNIEASWWETFDLGSGGKRRHYLTRHVDMLRILCDNAFAMQICLAKEDFGKSHVTCMKSIAEPVNQIMAATRKLLIDATNAAADGSISSDEADGLNADIGETQEAVKALGQKFNRARRTMFPDKVMNADLQSESFFVYCLTAYARHTMEYTYLMLNQRPPNANFFREVWCAFLTIFDKDVLTSRLDIHAFTIRGSISILACYYVGMYWVGFNAVASGTVALLIADFAGSALQKNLGRIQAVVIGAIVPHILYMLMGDSCDPAITVLKMVVLFLFESLTLYLYYNSATYGYIGILCAAFSLGTLVYPCGQTEGLSAAKLDEKEKEFGIASFAKMTQTTIGVIIMTLVDMYLAAERASDGATKNLLKGFLYIDTWFQGAFMDRDAKGGVGSFRSFKCRADIASDHHTAKKLVKEFGGPRQPGTIMGIMRLAQALGKEADLEPRYHRCPWPTAFFDYQCTQALKLRANLAVVEAVLKGTRRQGNTSYASFAEIRSTAAWEEVKGDVISTMGNCIEMVQAVLENETGKPLTDVEDKLKDLEGSDKLDSMPKLFKEIISSGLKYPSDAAVNSIEDDEICRLNVVLMMFDSNIETIADMMKECLKMIAGS